jgi:hypothetical protein
MDDESQCRAKGKENELAHGVGGLGGGDGSAHVAGTVACTTASLTGPHLQQWLLDLVSILSY